MKAAKYPENPLGRRIAKALWLLLATPLAALAVEDEPLGWANQYTEEEEERWQEQQGELPPYPEKGNLLKVDVDTGGLQFTVYLDKPSLVKRDDGVVRYTVILVSSTGVWNVSNEGLHCGEKCSVAMPMVSITAGNQCLTHPGERCEARVQTATEWSFMTNTSVIRSGLISRLHKYLIDSSRAGTNKCKEPFSEIYMSKLFS